MTTNDTKGPTGTARLLQELRRLKAARDRASAIAAEAAQMRRSGVGAEGEIDQMASDAEMICAATAGSLLMLLDDIIVTVEAAVVDQQQKSGNPGG